MTSEIAHEWDYVLNKKWWETMHSAINYILDGHLWMWWVSISAYWNILLLLFWLNIVLRWEPHVQPGTSGLKGLTWWPKEYHSRRTDDMLCPTDWDEINWLFQKCMCWKFKCIAKKGGGVNRVKLFHQNKPSNLKNSWRQM